MHRASRGLLIISPHWGTLLLASRRQGQSVSAHTPSGACWSQREGCGAAHYFLERSLELLHFVMGADSDANMSGHHRPDASDENILLGHGVDHLLAGAFSVEQEAVRFGGDVGVGVAVEPLKSFLADAGI